MLKFAIILLIILAGIIVYTSMDFSKSGILERKEKIDRYKSILNKKFVQPAYDFIDIHTKDSKKEEIRNRYQKAGFRHINFASNILICFIVAVVLALFAGIVLNNPFMAIVFFGIGWNVPGVIMGFLANKRLEKINDQVGMFLRMVIKRYQVVGDFYFAFSSTIEDFAGEEPMYSELVQTMQNMNRGDSIDDALHDLAHRTDNKFLRRFADYYAITADIGTQEAKNEVLQQALEQYEEHMELSRELRKQLSELTMEAYVMLAFVPCIVVYQTKQDPTYIPFMTTTLMGKVGSAIIAAVWLLCFWVINVKLGAPVDKEEE